MLYSWDIRVCLPAYHPHEPTHFPSLPFQRSSATAMPRSMCFARLLTPETRYHPPALSARTRNRSIQSPHRPHQHDQKHCEQKLKIEKEKEKCRGNSPTAKHALLSDPGPNTYPDHHNHLPRDNQRNIPRPPRQPPPRRGLSSGA